MATISSTIDDISRLSTPSSSEIPLLDTSEFALAVDQLDVSSLAASLTLPENTPRLLSSVQIHPPSTKQKHRFSLSTLLSPDIANAEINIAADHSFIESSSGSAIRELKRRYDQLAGVGPTLRSPYAITGFINQHGKSMYRLGHRDEHSAPAASAAEVEDRITQAKSSNESSPRSKRRSRLSMHFLPPTMFKNSMPAYPPSGRAKVASTTSRRTHRKTGSTPDLTGTGDEQPESTFAVTGRGHSQSVTSIDMVRASLIFQSPPYRTDPFGELLDLRPSSNTSTHSISTDSNRSRGTVLQPFGPGVTFNSPNKKGPVDRLRSPRQLREMQSFESTLTARQDDDHLLGSDESHEPDHGLTRPPSAIRLSQFMPLSDTPEPPEPPSETESDTEDEISSQLSSQYSIEVFNIIQKYSGLPVFESLVPEMDEGTAVIRLSLSTTPNAAPRDDPRFVIWGELQLDSDYDDYFSSTRDSPTETSSIPLSPLSRRRSGKGSKSKQSDASSSSRLAPSESGQRVLLAATIERWIAQLTSDLNYDELLNFFLTYRTYITAVDLCHLLICRFHWTLQNATSRDDEAIHRIVRVRTFVAIRYWLLTFFTVDFIPNRELRLVIADWLNTLLHDPLLKRHIDGVGIIRRLIKVAKDCKKAHTKALYKPKAPSPRRPPLPPPEPDHVLGKSFAQAIKKDDESVLDLDFLADEATTEEASTGFQSDPANAHLTVGHVAGAVVLGQARPTSLPLSSFGIRPRPDNVPPPNVDSEPVLQSLQLPPARHSALSRAFVRTIGRLGRWKRVFQPKSPSLTPKPPAPVLNGNVSAFDLELNASVDLLTTGGGVEEYLKMAESPTGSLRRPPVSVAAVAGIPAHLPTTPLTTLIPPVPKSLPPTPESITPSGITSSPTRPVKDTLPSPPLSPILNIPVSITSDTTEQHETSDISSIVTTPCEPIIFDENNVAYGIERPESFRSSSTDSFGVPLTSDGPLPPSFPGTHAPWQFDIVSIDDLDFSDTSSLPGIDPHNPPGGLRKQRKLPMRRDFEFVRRSKVSSMGIISHESLRDSVNSSTPSEKSPTSSGPHPIQRWQMKSLQQTFEEISNSSEDKGDVEAALRRLEGQMNPKVLLENAEKVDGWLLNMRQRMTNGDYANSIYSEDEVEDFFDEIDVASPTSTMDSQLEATDEGENETKSEVIPHATPSTQHQLPTPPSADMSPKDALSRVEEVVPVEILQSRMSSVPLPTTALPLAPGKFASANGSRHRSFILSCPAEQLAHHFSMIDRELFMSIKFEELVTGEWLESDEIDILDWAQYLKDRARWKAESRHSNKTTALAAVRARFNLMVSFVNAEVVLTPPNERLVVVSKLIKVAWRCYQLSNFQCLTAIITGLQSDWVNNAMRKPGWNRLGITETRMFRDLKQFTSKQDDFRIMRQAVDSIVDSKPLDSTSRTPSIISGSGTDSHSGKSKPGSDGRPVTPATCIPFIGIYLSQLRRLNKLPAVIDPTSPNTLMGVDQITANFDLPAYPDVFASLAPLQPSMHLEPLINVHKQRRVAEVIKSLVAGQHLSSGAQFDVDRKLFQKCLRIRGLDPAYLQRALNLYTD